MTSHELPKLEEIDTKSIISMQELDPSPVDDPVEGEYFPEPSAQNGGYPQLGLSGHRWDKWLTRIQKYSTYPPTVFTILHFTNTSLIPLVTRSVPASESYLLLTRPVYQAPGLEHLILTIPVLAHIISGVALRNIRGARRAKLYGAETRAQRNTLYFWPRVSLQARSGYFVVPLIGLHVLVNRATPLAVDGGSSGVGLAYAAHGIARSPMFWNAFYFFFVTASVWHFVGGWATWMGWRVTTVRKERGQKPSLDGLLGFADSTTRSKRQRKMWWVVNGIAAAGATFWLAGALGIVGRAGEGAGWEAKGWNDMYSQVPVIGSWL
ncbi:unnamed protein product [Penicillium olsonii]|uniref:Mitochondrial adapter protein MCP1 transmembrane domain-containing protein n=1 Tax=Penicillium olsonii TaxID=99116 RepID=A0A9W4MQU3_PENOL|nr:unnamed protein product [Penicillium olsonii]CAG8180830.1 unnamed protein product [Penicillium olsonii]CAG8245584.1 unnamed protein product [Penicillium olsonii]